MIIADARMAHGAHPSQSLGPGRCSICDLAKYTVSLFGRNCCLLYTISVVCHINLTNGWMTVLLPCQTTRQGLQVLYVIVGQKPLVCWRKLNNTKRVARNRFFFIWNNFLKFHVISIHVVLAFVGKYRHTNVHVPVPLSQKLGRGTFFPNPDLFSDV